MSKLRQKPFDASRLRLTAEEGFVLSRVDGSTTTKDLVALTGLEEARVSAIVERLKAEAVIEEALIEEASAVDEALKAFLSDPPPPVDAPGADALVVAMPPAGTPPADAPADDALGDAGPELPDDEASASEEDDALDPERSRLYRQIYEREYHPLAKDLRIKAAGEVAGPALFALCLDPEPAVIHALLGNPHLGLDHVRAVALHHRTQIGLEAIAKRIDHLGDRVVQRRLLRNPQLPGTILGRIANPRQLLEVYKIAIDREIPERSRALVRDILRKKFTVSSADEKASFLFKTEGRCLLLLVSCSLDAHATQILCSKQTYTPLLIQNLGRWSATPPAILAHLLKQPTVKRNPGLRKMLLKHPNTPSEAKRLG